MNPDHLSDTLELSEDQLRLLDLLLEDEGVVTSGADAIVPRAADGPAPLSFAQQRLWFIHRLEQGGAAYNVPLALRLRGRADLPLLERCLTEVVRRHEVLRTVFEERGGEPVQRVLEPGPVAMAVTDLSALPPAERDEAVGRAMREEAARPFDLERGPLLRVSLLRTADEEAVVLLTMHHIVSDEWSSAVLVREVAALYEAFARGAPSPLAPLPVQYADFAAWQRERLDDAEVERQLAFWRERLADAPPLLDLPTDRPRPAVPGSEAASRPFALPPRTADALRALSLAEGSTLFATLLAGWQALLARWSGQDDVSVGTPVANRPRAEVEGLIGFFVNTLVMRAELGGDPTVRALLARTREAVVEAQEHQDLPFERLVEALGASRTLRHTPLFQVLFTLQNQLPGEALRLGGVEMEPLHTESGSAKFDLVLELADDGAAITGRAEYRAELFDPDTVDRMLEHYAALLEGMAADPARRLSEIGTVGAEERRRVLEEWNATAEAYPRGACVHELFEEQADRTPDAPALRWEGGELSFAELDRRANQLAHRLMGMGVGADDRVGLHLERGPDTMAAVLGILKAGAAYLPLDPRYPPERLAYMLADAGARVLVTQESLAGALPRTRARTLRIDAEAADLARECGERPRGGASPEGLAYVVYTSGSTGTPKGVAMPHRPLVNLLAWHLRHGSGPLVTLQFTTISFDVSFQEIFSCWCAGGTLVLTDEQTRQDPAALLRQVEREGVERLFVPFAALQQLAETAESRGIRPASLREVVTAGEQLRATDAVRGWFGALGIALHNHYGPSETHVATAHTLAGDAAGWPLLAPIGRPVANARCYVLDAAGEPAPLGAPGELFLGGDPVARGYLGRPGMTAGRFVPDAFAAEPGARMYRTGDRARWTAAGVLEFLGRVDDQVKVRGFRIEPGEVEAALERHPEVREAVVVVREDEPGDRRLVGYVVPADGAVAASALRGWLGERLPEYMVPSAVVVLEKFPLTPSGKVARRALPAPDGADRAAEYVAPRTPTEETLAAVWAEVLRRERVGAHDDFFALGGHSLLATRVVSRLRAALGVELELRTVFEAPTLAGLAERVDALLAAAAAPGDAAPPHVRVERIFTERAEAEEDAPAPAVLATAPLSFAQQRLWLVDRMEPGSAAYHVPAGLRLRGRLDAALLERTLAEVVRRHEALRTVFREEGGEPVQAVLAAAPVGIPVLDLAGLPPEAREGELRLRAAEAAARPFDLERGPLLRATLLRLGAREHALVFVVHHVVSDGWSMGVLVNEVSALYDAFSRGRPSPLPELPMQYREYAVRQREQLGGAGLEAQLAWWRERLAGAPPILHLPTDRPRGAAPGGREGTVGFTVPAVTVRGLRALGRSGGATLFPVLLAGWQVLLARWSGQHDVVVGTPVAGRTRTELEGLIGFFVNTLVLRTELGGDPSLREVVARAWEATLGAQAHQDLPFDRLVEELQPERSFQHSPLFQVTFSLQNADPGELRLGGLAAVPLDPGGAEAKFDLGLELREDAEVVKGTLSFRAELWDRGTIVRLVERFRTALDLLAADPERHLSSLDLLGWRERERLEGWSRSPEAARVPPARCVHELFAEQAERTPDAVALVAGGAALTYAELARRAGRLARYLAACGVGPDVRVGICVERGPDMVVGLLGILGAGGAYVPLDPGYPAARLAYMLADARVPVLLTRAPLLERLPDFAGEVIVLGPDGGLLSEEDLPPVEGGPGAGVTPEHLAYVIYTSGSTGLPKGTEVPHRAIPGFFCGVDYARWDRRTVVLQHSSTSWDALTLELWPALLSGGTCVLYPGQTSEPAVLGEQVRRHGVNTLWLTAAYFNLVVDTCPVVLAGVAQVMTGGEAVSVPHARRALELYPELRLVNGYGPSETTVFAACHPVPAGFDAPAVPIGRPVGDRRVHVVDPWLVPVPEGVPGELCVGGPAVARGYLGRPELTAEKFVPDPFSAEPGARLYRSGDRARWLPDGALEFLGRTDQQIKVRGFRMEPGEVEAALRAHPAVRDAAVDGRDGRLVGWVVPAEGEVDPEALRAHLRRTLPEHMVPGAFAVLDALPLTASGKLDRRALPAPARPAGDGYVAPRTPVEARLAEVFAEVLKAERVGVHDDFFALGGHSLLATRVVSRVDHVFGVEMPVRALFEAPTVAGLAERLPAAAAEAVAAPGSEASAEPEGPAAARARPELTAERRLLLQKILQGRAGERRQAEQIRRAPRDRPLPLSFAQQRLWFIDQLHPGNPAYHIPSPMMLRSELDVRALRRTLTEIVRRHEALRTVFQEVEGEPAQVVRPAGPVPLPLVDLAGVAEEARARELDRLAHEDAVAPFDLRRGPLFRAALVREGEAAWTLLLTVHHIVSDGWSTGVLVNDFSALYGAYSRGLPSPLPEPSVQYGDFAAWQREWLAGSRMQAQLAYWRRRLEGAPPTLDLPTDRPRPAVPGLRGTSHRWELPAARSRAVRELCRREGVTPYMVFLAAWQLLLARYAGTDDVSVGTGIAGRNRLELEGLVGFFVNTLVLRTELSGAPTVRETLRRVREATLDAFANQDVPFERLVEELAPERSLQHAPLFQVMFTYQNTDPGRMDTGALELEPVDHRAEAAKFDLSLSASEQEDEQVFKGSMIYRMDLFDPATLEGMERHLFALLDGLAGDPERPVASLPLMDARERAAVLAASAGPARDLPRGLSVHGLFRRQAARTPDAVALSWDAGELTYAELDRRSDRLAAELARRGVGPGTRVGVFLERGPEWIESFLAVLKAGAVYVPLDPSNPAERTRYVLEDSGATVVLTAGALWARVPEFGGEVVVVDGTPLPPAPSPARGEGENDDDNGVGAGALPHSLSPDDLAYVVYTSGSTGRPKGALIGHGGVVNYLAFLAEEYGLGEGDAVLQMATPTFDASIRETLGPLTTGARLVLSPAGELAEPRRLLERVRERSVTAIMATVPSVLRPILAAAGPADAAALRLLLVSGEPLPTGDVRRAREVFGAGLRVVNQWGATECTMSSTLHDVADDEATPVAPVGVPIHNTRVYVLDPELEPAPPGVPGEAYVATPGLARGYGGRAALTAERFVPDPFSGEPGARMYRVGDRVRRRRDGVLEFLGRVDQQVKVQGVRVEPGEVEAVLRAHPSVAAAAVVAREERPGEARLVAYVVAADGADPSGAELRAYLAEGLPPYMVPAAWVRLDALPRLPSGKLDRRALPDPDQGGSRAEYVAPATATERELAEIWAEVLGVERVGAGDDFFALGGHSLLATRMISRVRRAFAVELPLRALFEAPTVAGTAARIHAMLGAGEGTDAPPVLPVPRDGRPLPLSFAQQRIWFLQELEPGSAAYNMPHPLRLEGALDVRALRRSLDALAARHETLRTVFGRAGGEAVQTVLPAGRVPLPVVDLAGLPSDAAHRETRRLAAAEAMRPFDLARGPLMRALLVRAAAEEHGLLFNLHHVIADGWSLGILVREVSELYSALAEGREPHLPALPVQYADYSVWQRRWLAGGAMERQVAFWRGQLAGAPPLLELPTDRPRPAVATEAGARVAFELPAELAGALDALSRREGATLFMTLMAGWQALLGRWSGQDDVPVGTPIAGRTRAETEGLIGMFVNTLVLRTRLDGRPTFRELLARVRETTLGAYAHQDVPFERLVEELQPERSLRHTPVFQVTFAMQNLEAEELRLGDLRLASLGGDEEAAKFDLTLVMTGGAERLGGIVSFRTDLFEARTVERMLAQLHALLEAVAADPERRPADVDLLDSAERRRLLIDYNAPGAVPAPTRTVHALFAEQAARTPDAPALRFAGETTTYAELDRRSAALARELAARGVGPDDRVGLFTGRSADMVVGMLAVLRAGGAYVPLDPEYPAERLAFMLEDAGVRVLVAQAGLRDRVPEFRGEVVALDTPHPPAPSPTRGEGEHDGVEAGYSADPRTPLPPAPSPARGEGEHDTAEGDDRQRGNRLPPERGKVAALTPPDGGLPVDADSLAYVIYTSGSTGAPKGAAVPHRAVVRLVRDADFVQFGPGDRVAQVANAAFDAATWEVWGALLNGGCVVGFDRETTLSPPLLAEALRAERVTGMFLTSALFTQTVAAVPDAFATVAHLLVGGDAVDPGAARAALAAGAPGRLVNGYGPTENTTFSTWHHVAEVAADAWTVPIGRPIAGSTAYVLDGGGEPVPEGWPGELCVGGWGVARGYLARPELTAERFVPDAFGGTPGARLYRTGDRVRWNARGELEFLGRVDFQVKIRGFRVEPGEVEAALAAHPAVREAVVVVRPDVGGDRRLVGYVAADAEAGVSGAELRAYLRGRMPEYMVPSAVVVMDALPLTANGKTDRRALPDPEIGAGGEAGDVAPRTATEAALAAVFAEVLGIERVGVHAGFFDLGGHSLLATRAVSRIREATGADVPLRALFEAPTVAALAERVDALLGEGAAVQAPPLVPTPRGGELPLSFAQQRLWFIDQLQPGSAAYNIPAALRIRGPLDAAALERTLAETVRRHETLRTVFRAVDGGAVAEILPAGPVAIPVAELEGLPEAEREAAVARRVDEEAARPFDLARGPLLRASLLRLDAQEHVLLFTMHHIVSDGWSMGVLTREVSALYAAYTEGRESPLPELPVQYADFAAWQRAWLRGEALERQLAPWRERLADAPATLELPTDRPVPAHPTQHAAARPFRLSAAGTERLRALGRGEGATLYMTLLAGWQALLGRWSGQDDVLVGMPVAGRTRREIEELIGFFVNTLVVRSDLSAAGSFRELLGQVRGRVLEAQTHQDVPFEKLVEELHPERGLRGTPFFRAVFSLQGFEGEALRLGPTVMEPMAGEPGAAKFDLSLLVTEGEDGLAGALSFRTELWDAATIDRLLEHFAVLLDAAASHADAPLAALPILPAPERALVLEGLNDTRRDYPAGLRVHDLFAAQAARTPDAPALSFRGETVSYAELAARSARLANHLRGLGVGPETRVGVCLERTPELVVAMMAVLRAGGAYVPLDPAYPRERLGYMQEDAQVSLVLTSSGLAGVLPTGTRALALDAVRAEVDAESAEVAETGVLPENLSHVIFTSGSTGRPKGVMIRHSSTVVLLHWLRENINDEERSAVLFSTSINFDVSVAEVFGTLAWGGKLVMVENALELASVAEPVVHASMVPTAAAELLRTGGIPASVRTLNLGGEPLPSDLAQSLYELPTVEKVCNLYGPTEDTTYSTYSVVARGGSQVFVGRPIANTRALVLDAELEPVPLGVIGELYLAGDGLSRGYASRPDMTAERYLPNPHGPPGSRMYRVMDRVRWRPDGELEYFGRTDFQVKVRGFRIELGEIETALRSHPAVREAVALVREDEPGERRIVAYVVPADGAAPDAAELRAHLRERVPEYMLPSAFVALEALPQTPNGKTDRRALPAPEAAGAGADASTAPRTPTEEVLAGIYADVLGVERVDAHADFFDLGGHSLLATRAVARAREAFGVDVELGLLFEAPSVAGLAARVDGLLRAGAGTQAPPIVPVPRDRELPLSFAQQRLWFIDQLQPGSAAYNVPAALRVRGPLDDGALERALAELVRRHEALRTTFAARAGRAVQVIHPAGAFALARLDLGGMPEAEREAELRRRVEIEENTPFDLAAGPLLRVLLVRLADEEHALLINMHHIVSDAWSVDVMVREVGDLYGAFREGRPSPLPELPVQYADFAAWQRAWLTGDVLDAQLAWWRGRLAGAPPVLELPTDRPRPRMAGPGGSRVPLRLPRDTADALRALARREGATLYITLMAGWQALLGRHAGQTDVVVGMPVAGRTRAETEGLIGFFVNTLVIRTRLDDDPDARALVRRVRAATLGAHQHQDVPFERLVEELGVQRSLDHTPLFQVVFNLRNLDGGGGARLAGAELEGIEGSGGAAKFDLTLTVADDGRELGGSLGFRTDLFDAAGMERLVGHFALLLRGMTESPEVPLSRLPILDAAERRQVLEGLNDTRRDYPAGQLAHDLFAAQAARTPDAPALSFRGETVSYAELAARSARLASHLRGLGVGPETRVGVCLERTPELVVAMMAVLRAGGAYVPLDPAYPRERLGYMQEDARVALVLTSTALAGVLPAGTRALALDAVRAAVDAEPAEVAETGVLPENLSHVIFTSGSTGRPRGVMIRHRSTAVLLHWLRENVSDEERSALLFSTSINFDVSVAEVFGTLAWGGKLVLVENALELATVGEPVVHASMVPTAAAELLRTGGIPAGVKTLNLGGEALPADLAQALYALGTLEKVGNLYGPTEDTTYSTYSVVQKGGSQVFVGRPLANTRALVLDAGLEPVPLGVVGELYLAGDGLSRGYAGAPDLTAERYLPDPHGPPGSRMYRVMDRVRWRADGELEYFGRTDFQVKVRGFRIEPGEVETALRAFPGVEDAVVVVREDTPGSRRLVAYFTAAAGAQPAVGDLRTHLRDAVPEHMVPSALVALEALPMTPNGKTDRLALPVPEGRPEGGEDYVAPRTPTEEALAAIWSEVLEVPRVGANDNFFDLGGHSLLVVQLHARLRETLAPGLSVADLFGIRTLADLARQVDAMREAEDDTSSREETLGRADARRSRLARQRTARTARPSAEDDAEDE
jgi:amino acid adenylation domain-containing protein